MIPKDADFPNLNSGFWQITSPPDTTYNCIAYAAGRTDVFWWPDDFPDPESDYWPSGILREESISAFAALFQSLGFEICPDGSLEAGFEKIAIYAIGVTPKHVSRQFSDGRWTSKLGVEEDVIHESWDSLVGPCYGGVAQFMRRPITK